MKARRPSTRRRRRRTRNRLVRDLAALGELHRTLAGERSRESSEGVPDFVETSPGVWARVRAAKPGSSVRFQPRDIELGALGEMMAAQSNGQPIDPMALGLFALAGLADSIGLRSAEVTFPDDQDDDEWS